MFDTPVAAYDLMEYLHALSSHPSVMQPRIVGDRFATCVSSQNWKPFIIGILAPDNPIDFVPVRRLKTEIKKSAMPQKSAKKSEKSSKKGGNGSGVVPMKNESIPAKQFREDLKEAFYTVKGYYPPEEILAFMFAQHLVETGSIYFDRGKGQWMASARINAPNHNAFGYHDTGAMPATFVAKQVGYEDSETKGSSYYWEDNVGNQWNSDGTRKKTDGSVVGIMRNGKLYFAPRNMSGLSSEFQPAGGNESQTSSFYSHINKPGSRYLGTDTEGGKVYISSYTSFPDSMSARIRYVSYISTTFPDALEARTPAEFEYAIQHGISLGGGKFASFHDRNIPNPDKKGPEDRRSGYEVAMEKGYEAYHNTFKTDINNSDKYDTDNPSQRIMSYGSSTDMYDPLTAAYGRNIEADYVRLVSLQAKIIGLKKQLALMKSIPQLILLVNPQEFRKSHENTIDFGVKTRIGNVVHTWLERPITVSASGVTSSQYAVYADMSGGLTNYNRIHSLSYRNLMSLLMIFKNNGVLYDFPSGTSSNIESDIANDFGINDTFGPTAGDGSILLTGSVYIYFDDHMYIGSFNNFSILDDAAKPHNLSYSFEFTVRYDSHIYMGQ